MNAHDLAHILLDGPDIPVTSWFATGNEREEITNVVVHPNDEDGETPWWPFDPVKTDFDATTSTDPMVELT